MFSCLILFSLSPTVLGIVQGLSLYMTLEEEEEGGAGGQSSCYDYPYFTETQTEAK